MVKWDTTKDQELVREEDIQTDEEVLSKTGRGRRKAARLKVSEEEQDVQDVNDKHDGDGSLLEQHGNDQEIMEGHVDQDDMEAHVDEEDDGDVQVEQDGDEGSLERHGSDPYTTEVHVEQSHKISKT
jgi:hypothetical protein